MSPTLVTSPEELQQILDLQKSNLRQNVSDDEKRSQGFVTMQFNIPMLQAMHNRAPSVIVKDGDKVIGYAIVFMPEDRHLYPSLESMFHTLEDVYWQNKPLKEFSYYVIGQICIDKDYRGQGVFELLYETHRETYRHQFAVVITEISTSNHRSIRAHERVGFQVIHTYRDELDEWAIVLWDWN
jgi:RimJ/RimL family protein N-acetyltransferase